MENQEQEEVSLELVLLIPKYDMFALSAITSIKEVHVLDVAPRCKEQISNSVMTLEDLRKKVLYQNTIDTWIGFCEEKNLPWNKIDSYKKFIEYLQNQNLNLKKYPLCVSDNESQLEIERQKATFAETLSESKDPNSQTYTVKLNDSNLEIIRKFSLT